MKDLRLRLGREQPQGRHLQRTERDHAQHRQLGLTTPTATSATLARRTAIYDAWAESPRSSRRPTVVEKVREPDALGRLVQVTTDPGGVTTVRANYYDGQQEIESDKWANSVYQGGDQYVWSARYVDAPICRDTITSAGTIDPTQRLFYLDNANYNFTAVVEQVTTGDQEQGTGKL